MAKLVRLFINPHGFWAAAPKGPMKYNTMKVKKSSSSRRKSNSNTNRGVHAHPPPIQFHQDHTGPSVDTMAKVEADKAAAMGVVLPLCLPTMEDHMSVTLDVLCPIPKAKGSNATPTNMLQMKIINGMIQG